MLTLIFSILFLLTLSAYWGFLLLFHPIAIVFQYRWLRNNQWIHWLYRWTCLPSIVWLSFPLTYRRSKKKMNNGYGRRIWNKDSHIQKVRSHLVYFHKCFWNLGKQKGELELGRKKNHYDHLHHLIFHLICHLSLTHTHTMCCYFLEGAIQVLSIIFHLDQELFRGM